MTPFELLILMIVVGIVEQFLAASDTIFTITRRMFLMSITTFVKSFVGCLLIVNLSKNPDTIALMLAYCVGSVIGTNAGVLFTSALKRRKKKNNKSKKQLPKFPTPTLPIENIANN
jgi:Na+/melibiose symporter-like transporter